MIRRPRISTLFPSTPLFGSRAVLVLHRQVTDAVKHRVDLSQRTLGRLDQRDRVLHVPLSLVETADLATKTRSEEHTSELQSRLHLVCRLLLEKKKQSRHPAL